MYMINEKMLNDSVIGGIQYQSPLPAAPNRVRNPSIESRDSFSSRLGAIPKGVCGETFSTWNPAFFAHLVSLSRFVCASADFLWMAFST